MKRILLLITIILGTATLSQAQTLKLLVDGTDYSDSTYTYNVSTTGPNEVKLDILIANLSNSAVDVIVKKNQLEAAAGHVNSFCIGECYPPSTTESGVYNIAANDTTNKGVFYLEFLHNGKKGVSRIEYTVQDRANSTNFKKIVIVFNVTDGSSIHSPAMATRISAFPNPVTSGEITFKVDGINDFTGTKIIIHNILGAKIKAIDLSSNLIKLNVSDLPNGIYLYSIEQKGRNLATKRFLVRK